MFYLLNFLKFKIPQNQSRNNPWGLKRPRDCNPQVEDKIIYRLPVNVIWYFFGNSSRTESQHRIESRQIVNRINESQIRGKIIYRLENIYNSGAYFFFFFFFCSRFLSLSLSLPNLFPNHVAINWIRLKLLCVSSRRGHGETKKRGRDSFEHDAFTLLFSLLKCFRSNNQCYLSGYHSPSFPILPLTALCIS